MSSVMAFFRFLGGKNWLGTRAFKSYSALAGGNLLAMILGVAGSIIQARFVGPEQMGVFRTFAITIGYLTILHLGTFDGLQREIPILVGAGRRDRAEQIAAACLAWIILACVLSSAGFVVLSVVSLCNGNFMLAFGWLTSIGALLYTFYGGYLATTYRTGHEFVRMSGSNLLGTAVSIAMLPLVIVIEYYGVCLRTSAGQLATTWRLHRHRPFRVRPRVSLADLGSALRYGLPLFAMGYVSTSLWLSVEGTVVRQSLGVTELGLFWLVALGRTSASQLLIAVHQVFTPRIAEEYGRSGRVSRCVRVCALPTVLATLGTVPIIVVGWLISRPMIEILVPNYVGCIPALQWMWLGLIPVALRTPLAVLWATADLAGAAASALAGFLAFCLAAWLSLQYGWGLSGIVNATTIGWLLQDVVGIAFIALAVRRERIADAIAAGSR